MKPPMDCVKPSLSPKNINVDIAGMARKADNSGFSSPKNYTNVLNERNNYNSSKVE